MKTIFTLLIIAMVLGCQPAVSDIFVEKLNPELVSRLIAGASGQTALSPDTLLPANPFWVRGLRLHFTDSTKSTILWYDEQDRVTGLVEYKNGVVTDSVMFFQNGQRVFSLLFNKEGKLVGPARYYYEDGRVREDGRFENGKKTGIWRHFLPDGRLENTHEYDRYGNQLR